MSGKSCGTIKKTLKSRYQPAKELSDRRGFLCLASTVWRMRPMRKRKETEITGVTGRMIYWYRTGRKTVIIKETSIGRGFLHPLPMVR
jgi:hypothetical protein